jgi:predicted esterase
VPAAAFGVCSFPPVVKDLRVSRTACAGRPYFLSSARQDHFAEIQVSRSGAALLRDVGLDLTYVESEGTHEMTDDAARQIGAWIAGLGDNATRPGGDLLADVAGLDGYFADLWDLTS